MAIRTAIQARRKLFLGRLPCRYRRVLALNYLSTDLEHLCSQVSY